MRTFVVVILCVALVAAAKSKLREAKKSRKTREFTLSFATPSSGTCTGDKIANCASYTMSVCSDAQYSGWVKDNCCAYCNGGGSSGGGAPTIMTQAPRMTSAPQLMSSGGGSCTDAVTNCADYTMSVCSNSDYATWVTQNCKKFCGQCTSSTGGGSPPLPGMTSHTASCTDTLTNCADYGADVCTNADYASWATQNCAKFCNKCGTSSSGGTPGASFCMDKIDCSSYAADICTSAMYASWAHENCPVHCNMCGSSSSGQSSSAVINTGGSTGGGSTGSCVDKNSNCAMLSTASHICTDAGAKIYAQQNCAMTCNMCSGSTSGGSMPVPGGGSPGTITGSSSACVYNGQSYQQGQNWKDACKYNCECVDGATGKYQCTELCVTWNLPSQCHLNPPAPGKCCQTPSCPTGFNVQYPPGYVAN